MNITKIKLNEIIIILFLIFFIHKLCKPNIVEGLAPQNKVKLKSCLKKVINRDCTHAVKAARLNRDCEYGENEEYIGITCNNTDLVDSIICSHLIGNGACQCQFGRNIIARSCSRPGVNKKCEMKFRDDRVLLDHIITFRKKAESIQLKLTKKEEELNKKIKGLEENKNILQTDKDDIDVKYNNQRDKIMEIRDMIKNLVKDIKLQTENLDKCEGELSEEKKEELIKLREKLQSGFLSLKDRIKEEKQKGFSKERAMGIIQDQKKELMKLKDVNAKEEIKNLEIFNKMMDIRERQKSGEKIDIKKEITENANLIGGIIATIIISIGVIVYFTRDKKLKSTSIPTTLTR
tara:strand:+ start:737 stop:1780 length:1044 start_codon:yes stop_codon:yes gene_type:complete